jgi:DNA-binding response OmpR family regulator
MAKPLENRSVLLVEDEEQIARLLATLVSRSGGTPVWAATAAAALEILESGPRPFHAAAIDVDLPDGNGVDIARQLRRTADASKVVVMSGVSDHEAEALRAGCLFLTKPFDIYEMLRLLTGGAG